MSAMGDPAMRNINSIRYAEARSAPAATDAAPAVTASYVRWPNPYDSE